MELFSPDFLSALIAIVIIDLVLAGDNAIVIALAARSLPRHLQKRAILWGTFGAIAVRTSLTLVVVWLLGIPGLLFVGGALLIWIAYKLLLPEDSQASSEKNGAAMNFWGAIRTVVIADTIMGLDNVLAVAGAAHGSFLLVVVGLLISVPIVIWGSTLILKFVERFPAFVYLGAGVLAWTAVKMMMAEPLIAPYLADQKIAVAVLYVTVVFGVLWAGFLSNHRTLESRISARIARFPRLPAAAEQNVSQPAAGDTAMLKILVPVDGSPNSLHAVRHVVNEFLKNPQMEIHVLNVQTPLSRHIAQFINKRDRASYYQDQAEAVLAPVRELLDRFRVPHATHTEVGHKAEAIAEAARRFHCDHIVMGTARQNSLTRMFESSVTNRVLDLTTVPVEIIVGDSISKLERFGVPAGIGAGLAALLLLTAD